MSNSISLTGLLSLAMVAQLQNPPKAALPNAAVQLKLECPLASGKYLIPRSDYVSCSGGPFGLSSVARKLHLFKSGGVSNANGVSANGSEVPVPAGSVSMVNGKLWLLIPQVQPGDYILQLEIGDVGVSRKIPVKVVEMPPRILNFVGTQGTSRTLSFIVQNPPVNAKITVARIPYPPRAWWDVPAGGPAQVSLTPESEHLPSGGTALRANIPENMGGGYFQTRVRGNTPELVSKPVTVEFPLAHLARPIFTLRYDGIQSITDTDELGDDEIYALFGWAMDVKLEDGKVDAKYELKLGPTHEGLEKGESQSAAFTVFKVGSEDNVLSLGLAVALFEKDGGDGMTYYVALRNAFGVGVQTPASQAFNDLAYRISAYRKLHNDELSDEYLGTKPVDLRALQFDCLKTKGWHSTSVVISGDGGQFRLKFSLRADPKVGAHEQS